MPAAIAAMATSAAAAPQNHGVFAAARIIADGWLPAVLGDTDADVGALLMPERAPICVSVELITTVAASIGEVAPDSAGVRPALDAESRRSRLRSAPMSAAVWYRRPRSSSSAFEMMRSSSGGSIAFRVLGGTGSRFKMPSNTTAVVWPGKLGRPVHISYNTTPNENRSVRGSTSSPRA